MITVFLAGSINQGSATDWQKRVESGLKDIDDLVVFNPRRDNWNADEVQDISNPVFREQVEWELDNLDSADLIIINFDKEGESPITLLELGKYSGTGKCIVRCPEGFWRRGNVQIVCARDDVPMFDTIEELIEEARSRIDDLMADVVISKS